jgi:hypothetical protein
VDHHGFRHWEELFNLGACERFSGFRSEQRARWLHRRYGRANFDARDPHLDFPVSGSGRLHGGTCCVARTAMIALPSARTIRDEASA